MMNYDQLLVIPFEECTFISKVVETEEVDENAPLTMWSAVDDYKVTKVTVTYISYNHNGVRYLSQPIHRSVEYVKLETMREKAIKIYLSSSGNYYFDIAYLNDK